MFYNTLRTTKSSYIEAKQNKLIGAGQTIINHRERLLNLQKKEKIKDLLITKFMQKYGIKNPEKLLKEEISKFLQGEKLTDADLKRLDNKVKKLLKEKTQKENLKNRLTQSLPEITPNTLNTQRTILKNENEFEENNMNSKRGKSQQKILSTEPGTNTINKPILLSSIYSPMNRNRNRKVYKNPEEELA